MPAATEPRDSAYDVVVVGGGLGGLTAGAFLAKGGRKVLLVDRLDGPGGYAHVFRRGPYLFDPAIHVTAQGGPGDFTDTLLKVLGTRDQVTFLPLEHLYSSRFPDHAFYAPTGSEDYIVAHQQAFPHEADGIRRLFEISDQTTRESQQLPISLSLKELEAAVAQFPVLFKYRGVTLGEVLDECLTDPRAKAVCTSTWPYVGLPPSQLSFFTWSAANNALIYPYYVQGSLQKLADAFTAALEMHGGEMVLQRQVEKIHVENGKVTGVTLDRGQHIRAPLVVSNADAPQTFQKLVGLENLPNNYARKVRRMTPSCSAFVVFAATRADFSQFDARHENFIYRHYDHDRTWQDIQEGKAGGMWINIPTLVDPSLAPPGEHLVIITSLAALETPEPWEQVRERFTEELLDEAEGVFPGFRAGVTFVESATPRTFVRYSACEQGAIYGWENTPLQAGTQRPDHQTPVEGLYLAGHWSQPGTGSVRVIYSGALAAQRILGYPHFGAFLEGMAG